ncbi:MAG: hypothetical protein ACRELC_08135, partial [Gemmatimonadota bacterium]
VNALRFADPVRPGLDIGGNGRGCNESRGRFEILDVEWGAHDYLRSLHAAFVHYCDNTTTPLRGEVDLVARAAPRPVDVEVELAAGRTLLGSVPGTIDLHGRISCNQPVSTGVSVRADVRELNRETAGVGSGTQNVPGCSSTPTSWRINAKSRNGIPFTAGAAEITIRGEAVDGWYTAYAGAATVATDVFTADAEVQAGDTPPDSDSPGWPAVIALSIVAAIGWILVIALGSILVYMLISRRRRSA